MEFIAESLLKYTNKSKKLKLLLLVMIPIVIVKVTVQAQFFCYPRSDCYFDCNV